MGGHVVAMGGGGFLTGDIRSPLDDLLLSLSPRRRPRVAFLATAVGDADRALVAFHEAFAHRDCDAEAVRLFGIPDRPAERIGAADVIVADRPGARGYTMSEAGVEPIETRLLG